jgi:hypothetical protein
MAGSFAGIDPGSSLTGTQARSKLESSLGRPLTDPEIASTGYNDPTGNTAVSGADFNRFMQQAAGLGGGAYTPWTAPTPNTTPPPAAATGAGGAKNTWAGVDPASSRTGLQARAALEQQLGRPLTAEELQWSQTATGYTDPTGAAPLSGANYNLLMQEAARRSGGTYNPWAAPAPGTTTTTTGGAMTLPATPAPGFTAPRPDLPGYTPPSPFSYDPFHAPTWAEMQASDPGIQARYDRGTQALEHSAAAKGALHSPNTMAGLIDYGQKSAADEYGNAYNRAFGQWQTGYNTAADTYDRNYGVTSDTYQNRYKTAMDQYNANLTGAQLEYAPSLLSWQNQNRTGELGYDRAWQQYVYGADDAYRRETRDQNRYDTRDYYNRDDLWRRYQLEQNRLLSLAQMGMT